MRSKRSGNLIVTEPSLVFHPRARREASPREDAALVIETVAGVFAASGRPRPQRAGVSPGRS
jgi:hypothetical protein